LLEILVRIVQWNSLITNFLTSAIFEAFNEYLYLRQTVFKYGYKYVEGLYYLGDKKELE